jgi:exocyst complex component 6
MLPLSQDVKKINPNGVAALAKDVEYLANFVNSLGVPILRENLDELQQTVNLYGRVDAVNGPVLLEKYV